MNDVHWWMPAVHRFAKAHCLCSLGRVWRKKELICPEKDYTLILFGGLALRLIISDFIKRQAIKTTGVIRSLARFFNGFCSAFFCWCFIDNQSGLRLFVFHLQPQSVSIMPRVDDFLFQMFKANHNRHKHLKTGQRIVKLFWVGRTFGNQLIMSRLYERQI